MISLVKDPDEEEGVGYSSTVKAAAEGENNNGVDSASPFKLNFMKSTTGGGSSTYFTLGTNVSGGMEIPSGSVQDNGTVLEKGFNAAKVGAATVASGARSIISSAQGAYNDSPMALNSQQLFYAAIVACAGGFLIFFSFILFPLAFFSPGTVSLLFTIGSLCIFSSLMILKGFNAFIKHMSSPSKLPFSVSYFVAMLGTLAFSLFWKSYLLVMLFSIIQIVALFSFLISYVPGGSQLLGYIGTSIVSYFKNCFGLGSSRETLLPY